MDQEYEEREEQVIEQSGPTGGSHYRKPSFAEKVMNSCMVKLLILVTIVVILFLIAHATVPSIEKMQKESEDNVWQCLEASHGVAGDKSDDLVNNFGATFTNCDSTNTAVEEQMRDFNMYNHLESYQHYFYGTTRVYNNYHPEGKRVGIGLFGGVISTMNFRDFVMRSGVVRKGYNQKIITTTILEDDQDLGENPDLSNTFEYDGE